MRIASAVCIALLLLPGCSSGMLTSSQANNNSENHSTLSATDAIAKVLLQHSDFPATPGVQKIVKHNFGPHGSILNGTMRTECQSVGQDTYHVTFTKDWNIIVNEVPAKSRWEYEVTPKQVRLISAEDHADVINIIK